MFDIQKDELVEGSVPRLLLLLSAPLVAQNLVHVVNGVVDVFWLGQLSEEAIAAAGLNLPVIVFVYSAVLFAVVGTQILVAQRVGRDDLAAARRVAVNGLGLSLLAALVVAVAVGFNADRIVVLLGAEPAVVPLAAIYLATMMAFIPFAATSDAVENSFVAWGDTRAALHINLVAVGVNLVFDPLLIFGVGPFPALGVQGAALATGLGYVAGFGLGLAYALGLRETFRFTRDAVAFDRDIVRELVEVGAPLSGQRAASQSVRVLIIGLVSLVGGTAGLAAYTVGARVASIAVTPATAMQQAAQSMIGQNLGANRPDRAARTMWSGVGIATVGFLVLGAIQLLVPETIAAVFIADTSAPSFAPTVRYLEILAYGYWAIGATSLFLAGFNGTSNTKTSLWVTLVKYWGIRFPIAVAALPIGVAVGAFGFSASPGLGLGLEAVFWAVTLSNVLAAVGVAGYYWYTSRRTNLFTGAADRLAADAD
ncbi:MATE family efflux transporter [Haloferacaceae archaeon DSL9]